MVHGKNRIPYWIDWRLTGLAEPDYGATISFGLPIEPEDSQYGKYRPIPARASSRHRRNTLTTAPPKPRPLAVAYIRVSSSRQAAEDKVSLGEQTTAIEAYCQEHGLELIETFQVV